MKLSESGCVASRSNAREAMTTTDLRKQNNLRSYNDASRSLSDVVEDFKLKGAGDTVRFGSVHVEADHAERYSEIKKYLSDVPEAKSAIDEVEAAKDPIFIINGPEGAALPSVSLIVHPFGFGTGVLRGGQSEANGLAHEIGHLIYGKKFPMAYRFLNSTSHPMYMTGEEARNIVKMEHPISISKKEAVRFEHGNGEMIAVKNVSEIPKLSDVQRKVIGKSSESRKLVLKAIPLCPVQISPLEAGGMLAGKSLVLNEIVNEWTAGPKFKFKGIANPLNDAEIRIIRRHFDSDAKIVQKLYLNKVVNLKTAFKYLSNRFLTKRDQIVSWNDHITSSDRIRIMLENKSVNPSF